MKLLREFVVEQADVPEQVADALDADDPRTAQRFAHTLKGLAGTLGALNVQKAAGELEHAIRAEETRDQIEVVRETLSLELDTLVGPLAEALGSAPSPTLTENQNHAKVDANAAREAAQSMLTLLAESDAGAVDLLQERETALRSLFSDDAWRSFARDVNGYAFADAHAALEGVLA